MSERFYKLSQSLAAIPQRQIPATAKIVLAILGDRMGKNDTCWPGIRTIAADSGLSVETVIQSIRILEGARLVTVDRRGSGKVNHYRVVQSAQAIRAPKNLERSRTLNTGDQESCAQALKTLKQNQTDPLNQRGTAAPATATDEPPAAQNGATSRLVAAWVDGHQQATGQQLLAKCRGKVGGMLKYLLKGRDQAALSQAISVWFGTSRRDYGIELLKAKLEGGDTELTGRPRSAPEDDSIARRNGQMLAAMEQGGST